MWTNLWDTLKALAAYGERLAWLEKRMEKQEREQDLTNDRLTATVIKLELMVEREKWREEKSRQALENERLNHAFEQAQLENERLRLELERERRQLPPAITPPLDKSQTTKPTE